MSADRLKPAPKKSRRRGVKPGQRRGDYGASLEKRRQVLVFVAEELPRFVWLRDQDVSDRLIISKYQWEQLALRWREVFGERITPGALQRRFSRALGDPRVSPLWAKLRRIYVAAFAGGRLPWGMVLAMFREVVRARPRQVRTMGQLIDWFGKQHPIEQKRLADRAEQKRPALFAASEEPLLSAAFGQRTGEYSKRLRELHQEYLPPAPLRRAKPRIQSSGTTQVQPRPRAPRRTNPRAKIE